MNIELYILTAKTIDGAEVALTDSKNRWDMDMIYSAEINNITPLFVMTYDEAEKIIDEINSVFDAYIEDYNTEKTVKIDNNTFEIKRLYY